MSAKNEKGSFVVIVKCTIEKELICEDCTYEQAGKDPYDYAVDERETQQIDWEVISVTENN